MARYAFDVTDPNMALTIVAVADAAVIGFATAGPSADIDTLDAGAIRALYVDPKSWRLGIGRRLLAEARTHLYQRGFTEAILWVLAGNDRAQRFYHADGWLPDDQQRTQEIWGVRVDEARYRRRLP